MLGDGVELPIAVLPVFRLGMHEIVRRVGGEVVVGALNFPGRGWALQRAMVKLLDAR